MRVWRLAPYGVKPCKDGFVFLQVVERYHWEGLVEMMGSPEWARDPRYLEPEYRFEHRRDIEARIAPWLLEQSRQAFAIEAQRRGVPFAPINELADLARIPQLHHRCFFRRVNGHESAAVVPGMPFRISRAAKPAAGRTQTPAVRDAGTGPLAGLRVIDFGHVWAGPYCAALLADMGAEVIKIESHQRVDIHRRQGPYPERRPGLNRSGVWNTQNRGKRSVSLNLSTPRGRELARDLVAKSDVAIENFAPGVMQRLGLDYAALSEVNPGLVMASLSAFGQDGPQKGYVGYGPSLDAWAGLDRMTAYHHGGPNALGGMFPDTSSAIHGAAAILAALHERERTGKGCHIDVSELEVSILLLGDLVAESLNGAEVQRLGNSDAHHFPHGCYACAGEDAWIAVSVPDAEAWRGLCRLLGRSDWDADKRLATSEGRRALAGAIEGAISAWARDREAGAAMRELQASSVPAAVANTARTLLGDPQLAARGFFQVVEHPETGPQPLYGPIWRFDGEARRIDRHAPLLGADNDYVLGTLLGLAPEAIAALAAEKVVY
jgi:crotonobetainyl-CoA:carnitine CoA-transferase CaiB-like acyl-CoA transferase